jgi:hypothetical protein
MRKDYLVTTLSDSTQLKRVAIVWIDAPDLATSVVTYQHNIGTFRSVSKDLVR